ncbi:MAG TPA: hypothetical protein VJ717_19295 [Gemmatimonadaceae bacterium]|nr:hypothetical protein [Gemmatimonadaceae bacterium]
MRCSFCSFCLTWLLVACVTSTTREFFPSPENPRYTPERGSHAVREYLRLRCPELKPPKRDSATIFARVRVDTSGKATSAELTGTSGDDIMDGVIGTVAAQLDLAANTPRRAEYRASIAYACRDTVAARITVAP